MKESAWKATEALLQFIRKSPTAFHAVEETEHILESNGFVRLEETDAWSLTPGQGYYVTRNGSSVIAFRMPAAQPDHFLISASHTDSPTFKLKPLYQTDAFGTYWCLNTEPYGGTIFSSWLDRPLSVAGRVILSRGDSFTCRTVCIDRDLVVIPNLAIHMNREVNRGYAYDAKKDMLPLFSQGGEADSLEGMICESVGCDAGELAGMELYLYNRTPASVWGADKEFFSAPRIDNLMCLYGTLCGFCEASPSESAISVFFSADNEETGSSTKQGAGSVFLSDTIDRICEACSVDRRRLLASSFMVSADNGHAKHPNHPAVSDAQNAPKLNGGVVIKSNAAQKYATDAMSAALFEKICARAGVPVQHYSNRSDLPGGSTLGSISNTLVPLCTVDIGMAQLAMHSSYETAGCEDVAFLIRAMKQFYESRLSSAGDGSYELTFCEREVD